MHLIVTLVFLIAEGLTFQSKDCTRGFPENPVSNLSTYMRSSPVTLLIPAMNFTCNATIAGFAVAGTWLNRAPHSQLQLWRKNSSHSSVYYKIGSISVNIAGNGGVCNVISRIANITYWCILFKQVSVQSGDILGLQLPNNNLEILFTSRSRGPVNYIYEQEYLLNSTVDLSHNENYTIAQQLPQIAFNLTSGRIIFI